MSTTLGESCIVAVRLGAHGMDLDGVVTDGVPYLAVLFDSRRFAGFRRRVAPSTKVSDLLAAAADVASMPVFVRIDAESFRTWVDALTNGERELSVRFIDVIERALPVVAPHIHRPMYARSSLAVMASGPERFFAAARANGWTGVMLPDRDWTGGIVTLAHRYDLEAIADGVVQEHRMLSLLRMGIDVLSSTWPDRMAAAASDFARTVPTER